MAAEPRVPDTSSSTIVLIGAFNPLILQPSWLAEQGAIKAEEAAATLANEQFVITAELVAINFGWFTLEATRERATFATGSEAETPLALRDVVVNVFSLLSHTPIRMLGMNHMRHAWLPEGAWSRLREILVPASPWERLLGEVELDTVTARGPRSDGLDGVFRVSVEPSQHIPGGVWINVNNHVDLSAVGSDAHPAVDVLTDTWEESLSHAENTMEALKGFV
jgi:hypothetical protein